IIGTTDTNKSDGDKIGDKFFRHVILGAELTLGKRLVLTGSYNFLRRKELAITTKTGMAGFAFGVNLNFDRMQIHYARTFYHIAGAVNELSLNMNLHKFIPAGKRGHRLHWDAEYPDWD
ncbi:MAG: hypothetical protein EBZ77_11330, partial [Chitinophagia bacterium]|nr:hypothetical protein [Chitinophagia bacterium]